MTTRTRVRIAFWTPITLAGFIWLSWLIITY